MSLVSEKALSTGKSEGWGRHAEKRWPPAHLWIPGVLVALAMLIPIFYLALRAFGSGNEVLELIFRQRTLDILLRSLLLTVAVTGASVLIAVPIAWLTVRTDLPFRKAWSVLTSLPLVIPSYVFGMLVIAGLGPKGMLQGFLEPIFGIERLPQIYGFPGALLTIAFISFPYVMLTVRAALWRLDPAMEEASRMLGRSNWSTFFRVTLPLLKPAIVSGALLVALYTLSDFGAVSLMKYETFTWAIYNQYLAGYNREIAAALSLILILCAAIVLMLEWRARSRSRYHRTHGGAETPQKQIALGKWRWPALLFCSGVVLFSLILPVSILLFWLVRGLMAGEPLLLLWSEMTNSIYVSALAAIAVVLAALPVAILTVRYHSRLTALLERLSYLGFALPGIAVALALIFFSLRAIPPLYQTLATLIFAYLILFLPTALGAIRASFLQIKPSMEEAARIMGKTPFAILFQIQFPLMRTGILAGAALVFLLTMKELPATKILGPIGFETLAVAIWSAADEAFFARTAAPSLFLILVSSASIALLMRKERWL